MAFALKKYGAEFIGTALLVLLACGAAAILAVGGVIPVAYVTPVALAFGLVLLCLIYIIGGTSGCHVNPAVSLGMLLAKRMNVTDFVFYVAAQFLGAIAGAAALYGIFQLGNWGAILSLGANGYGAASMLDINVWGALIIETILTAVFVGTILAVTKDKDKAKIAPFVIALALVLVHIVGIMFTGTSVNPARSFGPALFMWINGDILALSQYWVFLVAPMAGGAIAGICAVCCGKCCKKEAADAKESPAVTTYSAPAEANKKPTAKK
ncbi:MAG: aquaporin [Firmicutes bacterium]|nr:aquaporin [Bacillota bacterium]